jgi:hypothetical protein
MLSSFRNSARRASAFTIAEVEPRENDKYCPESMFLSQMISIMPTQMAFSKQFHSEVKSYLASRKRRKAYLINKTNNNNDYYNFTQ